ncbi:hypothetical protein X798_00986 [Onchocerca flexuosa]|uniref:Secreted protein n=2 Tax=Onchocerca flexuosa TaxID=387005 RepID=A0A183HCP0_9BILA|nr:hypothetical protein X798_00986 [Onchocerca flexuosa]VDO42512.1 unnamed protein product [Onchocerca flexuosa]
MYSVHRLHEHFTSRLITCDIFVCCCMTSTKTDEDPFSRRHRKVASAYLHNTGSTVKSINQFSRYHPESSYRVHHHDYLCQPELNEQTRKI